MGMLLTQDKIKKKHQHLIRIAFFAFRSPETGFRASLGAVLGPSWSRLGAILEPSWAVLALGAVLGPSLAVLGPSWASEGRFWHPSEKRLKSQFYDGKVAVVGPSLRSLTYAH